MATVVACSLPAGLVIEQNGETVRLNGGHVGLSADPDNLPRNGFMPDTPDRGSGYGLTRLDGDQEAAFLLWVEAVTKGPDGKPLQHPFAPIASGAIIWAKNEADARKEAAAGSVAVPGLDPDKDLPEGIEADKSAKEK